MTEVSEMQCHCGTRTPEDVAYSLMIDIARTEKIAVVCGEFCKIR